MAGKDKKGKKPHKNKPTSKKYSKYKVEGEKVFMNAKFCPRCGPGIFLSEGNNKKYCGKCHYSEFEGKEPPAPEGVPSKEEVGKEEIKKE